MQEPYMSKPPYIPRAIDDMSVSQARQDFMTKVYAWMVGGLLITGFTALYVVNHDIFRIIFSNSILFFGIIIAEFALVVIISARIDRLSPAAAGTMFLAYSLLNGVTLSTIFAVYTLQTIQQVFFIAAGMFAALSIFGFVTKKNLNGIGSFMLMGLFGMIIAIVVNMFVQSSGLDFIISVIGVIIFAGLTAYDTQKLKDLYDGEYGDNTVMAKSAVLGALMLYLDFINLFLFLLRLFGRRD